MAQRNIQLRIFPGLVPQMWTPVNLAANFQQHAHLDMRNPENQEILLAHTPFTYGGFLENRTHLWDGFEPTMKYMIHLGVDVSAPAGQSVAVTCDATVIDVLHDHSTFNGWGGRVIFKIDHKFPYLLYGHLDPKSITVCVGDKVSANTVVGRLGDARVNGGWFTHLHVQQMRELWPGFDGYADACPRDIAKWRKMVCDPTLLL